MYIKYVYVYHLNVYVQHHSGEHIYDNIMTAGRRDTFMSYLSIIYNTVLALRGDENYPYNRARKDGYMTDIYMQIHIPSEAWGGIPIFICKSSL